MLGQPVLHPFESFKSREFEGWQMCPPVKLLSLLLRMLFDVTMTD